MNKILRLGIGSLMLFVVFLGVISYVDAMDDPGFSINRMVVSRDIEDREPVGSGDAFSSVSEKLFCFLDARDIEQDIMVSFVWYHESREMARMELPLKQGRRWRTWSSKKINGLKGDWKVELQDSEGIIRSIVSISVE